MLFLKVPVRIEPARSCIDTFTVQDYDIHSSSTGINVLIRVENENTILRGLSMSTAYMRT